VSIESDLVFALALKPFRTMPVVPTLAELTDTPTHASLPRRPFGSTVDELLGCYFHFVREDMLGPVRADLKKGVANTQPMKTLYNVHVTGVHRDKVVMSFELHKDHAYHKMSDDRKRDFWERTSILRLHGLVLLLDNGRPVRLAFVTGRQHVLQNKVGLTLQDCEDVDALLQELERPCEHRTVFHLTSTTPSFFSYEPVLPPSTPPRATIRGGAAWWTQLWPSRVQHRRAHGSADQLGNTTYVQRKSGRRVEICNDASCGADPSTTRFAFFACIGVLIAFICISASHRYVHFVIPIPCLIQYLITSAPTQRHGQDIHRGCTLPATLCTRASSEYCCAATPITPSISSSRPFLHTTRTRTCCALVANTNPRCWSPTVSALNKPARVLTVCQSQSTATCAVESTNATHMNVSEVSCATDSPRPVLG
jgi:hypothetical protein